MSKGDNDMRLTAKEQRVQDGFLNRKKKRRKCGKNLNKRYKEDGGSATSFRADGRMQNVYPF